MIYYPIITIIEIIGLNNIYLKEGERYMLWYIWKMI